MSTIAGGAAKTSFAGVPLDAPAYVGVTDGERLVVLPATRDLRAHADRTVTLARDASGKHLRVIAYEFDRGR